MFCTDVDVPENDGKASRARGRKGLCESETEQTVSVETHATRVASLSWGAAGACGRFSGWVRGASFIDWDKAEFWERTA